MSRLKRLSPMSNSKSFYGMRYEVLDWEFDDEYSDEFNHIWIDKNSPAVYSFHFFGVPPDIPTIKNINKLREHYREFARRNNGGIIKVEIEEVQNIEVVETIFKFSMESHGVGYIGSITIPFRDCSFVIKAQCQEMGNTGFRDTVVFQKMMGSGVIKREDGKVAGWFKDPYDENLQEGPLMNLSEAEEFDVDFPEHPLSIIRGGMARVRRRIAFDKKFRGFESESTSTENYFEKGINLGLSGNYQQAVAELSKATHAEPNSVEAHTSLGVALHKVGEDERALGSYDTALKLSPQHAETHYFRANLFYVHQQMPEAIAGYTTAIGLNPALIHAYKAQPPTNRLTDYTSWPVEMSWITKAADKILRCDQSLNESAKNIDLYKNRGAAYYELWNYDRAVEDFSVYLSTTPDDVQVVHWRGLAYDQVGQYELAIADYTKAIELDPNSSSAYYIDRGVSYGKMGDLQYSLADFDKAIQLNPNNPKGYYNRAMACYRLEEFDRAIEDLSQVLSLSPDDVGTYRFRGRIYEQIGSNQKAIEDYEAFLRLSRVPQDKVKVEQRIANLKRKG